MADLNDNLNKLKNDYRTYFGEIASDIESALGKLDLCERKDYLINRLNNVKNKSLSCINDIRAKYSCAGCGVCCRFAVSEFSPAQIREKAKNGDNFANQFIRTFIPYKSEDEYSKIYPQYLELLKGQSYYVYRCPKVTDDNKCPVYDVRPQICRDFPDNPIAFLPPSCGFYDWKLKSESIWLKLNAEVVIINHYLENL